MSFDGTASKDRTDALERVVAELVARRIVEPHPTEANAWRLVGGQSEVEQTGADARRAAEARKRFKASVLAMLVSGQLAADSFDWSDSEFAELSRLADDVLEECGLAEGET